jgi:hypothetical protein
VIGLLFNEQYTWPGDLVPLNVSLQRDLVAPWFELVLEVAAISHNNAEDIFKWKLHNRNFIVY